MLYEMLCFVPMYIRCNLYYCNIVGVPVLNQTIAQIFFRVLQMFAISLVVNAAILQYISRRTDGFLTILRSLFALLG